MAVITRAGQPLRRDRALLTARPGLDGVEQREPERLLELSVPVDLDVRRRPESVEVLTLLVEEALPAGVDGALQRRAHLIA